MYSLLSPVHFLGISPYDMELVEKLLSGSHKKTYPFPFHVKHREGRKGLA